MTHVQPYPISRTGSAGLGTAFNSELPAREAVSGWCKKLDLGWFNLKRVGEGPFRSVLWEATWPLESKTFRFVTTPA